MVLHFLTTNIMKTICFDLKRQGFSIIIAILLSTLVLGSTSAQTNGDFRSAASGLWSSVSTWQQYNGTEWVAASVAPSANNAVITISIRSAHTVTIMTSINALSRTIIETGGTLNVAVDKTLRFGTAVTGNKLTIQGTLNNSGIIVFSGTSVVDFGGLLNNLSTGELSFSGNTVQLSVSGTFRNGSDEIVIPSNHCIEFNLNGLYEHNFTSTAGVIPNATWNIGSTCRIIGYSSNSSYPENIEQTFYNFDWNTPALTASPIIIRLGIINGNLTVTSTGTGSLRINSLGFVGGNFTVSPSSRTLFGRINATVELKGNITFGNSSIVSVDKLSLYLSSTSLDQTIDAKGLTVNELVVNNSGHVVNLASSLKIKESLTIMSASTILNSNGHLRLLSTRDEISGDAFIAELPIGCSISGNVTVDRYMSNEGNIYRYISSPVANSSVSSFQADIPVTGNFVGASGCAGCAVRTASMFYYSPTLLSYIAFPEYPQTNTATFETGRGYTALINQNVLPGPVTIHWTGQVNQGPVNLPVAFNGNPNSSWNLVGNPYPSTIDWSNAAGWSLTNVAQTIVVKDNGTGMFRYYPDELGGETFNIGQVAKGQAFWVRTTGPNPSLQVRESAKTSEGIGTFYRKATDPVDRISLVLSNGSVVDRTYVKVVKGAVASIDNFDAPKMTNDGIGTLNFSSVMKKSNLTMAINAVDEITCGDTIKLKVNGAKGQPLAAGNYSISFSSSGIMDNLSWTLRDTYLKTDISVSDGSVYSFAVTSVSASKSANRFQLVVADRTANAALPVEATKNLCANTNNVIKIANTESHVDYAVTVNGNQASVGVKGNGSEISFQVAASNFIEGNNVVKIVTNAGCGQAYLLDTVVVEKLSYYVPQVHTALRCKSERASLTAADVPEGNEVRWYSSSDAVTALASGPIFETPVLEQSKTYYVSGVNAIGCEGDRIPVQAQIRTYDDVVIAPLNSSTLGSNYKDGNQWYLDNERIAGATQQSIVVEKQGVYSVNVTVGNCLTTGQFEFMPATVTIPGPVETNDPESPIDGDASDKIMVYPNPVTQAPLHIDVPESVTEVKLLDGMGAMVERITFLESDGAVKKSVIDLRQYAAGIYFVSMKQAGKITTIKVLNR